MEDREHPLSAVVVGRARLTRAAWLQFRTVQTNVDDNLFMRSNPSYLVNVSCDCSSKGCVALVADRSFSLQLLPPHAYTNRSTSYCTRYAHTSTNKIRCPVNIVKVRTRRSSLFRASSADPQPPTRPQWTPDARRVLTGSTSGEFTLWNGLTFNFETILQVGLPSRASFTWPS